LDFQKSVYIWLYMVGVRVSNLTFFNAQGTTDLELPIGYGDTVLSFVGLFSDVTIDSIDLHKHFVKSPHTTKLAYVEDDGMNDAKLVKGCVMIVSTKYTIRSGERLIIWLRQEERFISKIILVRNQKIYFINEESPHELPLPCTDECKICGTLQHVIYPISPYAKIRFERVSSMYELFDDAIDDFDLNKLLIKKRASTFYRKAEGTSMEKFNIYHNSINIVDRSMNYDTGEFVSAYMHEERCWTLKRLQIEYAENQRLTYLIPGNEDLQTTLCTSPYDEIGGVVTHSIYTPPRYRC